MTNLFTKPFNLRGFDVGMITTLLVVLLFTACGPSAEMQQQGNESDIDRLLEAAETDEGLFDVHQTGEHFFFEIPKEKLEREMVILTRYREKEAWFSESGPFAHSNMQVSWERKRDRILLRAETYHYDADENLNVYKAVNRDSFTPILASFDIEKERDGSIIIDVSDLYTGRSDAFEISQFARQSIDSRGLDPERSHVESIRSYPENVEVGAVLTYNAGNPPSESRGSTMSAHLNHSMILLPEEPMERRWYDERIGLRGITQLDYGRDYQGTEQVNYIQRYRLEPSDTSAYLDGELVEPEEPWVWYIDPATPEKWIPYFKEGLLEWNEAFEEAGFKNAIKVKVAPVDDPDFSMEDARYSVLRYNATNVRSANAGGGAVDPRSGELISGHINMLDGLEERLRWWVFSQMGARHDDLRGDRIPEDMMGEALRYVVSHEIAHVVGLPHNQMGNHAFPTDSLRSASFIEEWGHAASVVGRTRFNSVAQPGDDIPEIERRRVGVADKFAVKWGYSPMPQYDGPDEEWDTLNQMVMEHNEEPWFRFLEGQYTAETEWDPYRQTESMSDDGIKASEYGIKNLKRLIPDLVERVSQEGQDYWDLENHYLQIHQQWQRFMQHATVQVGGSYTHKKRHGEDGPIFTPVEREEQIKAMEFLEEHAFQTPEWLLDEEILRLLEHAGALERVRGYQMQALERFLLPNRFGRIAEQEFFLGDEAYSNAEMMDDLREMLWSEVTEGEEIDAFRRNIQRGYLDRLNWLMTEAEMETFNPPASGNLRVGSYDSPPLNAEIHVSQSDVRMLVRDQLRQLEAEIEEHLDQAPDRNTRMHLEDVLIRIQRMM